MKQVFEIPKGCNRVAIEKQGNKIVTTFEPEFKDGDVIYGKYNDREDCRSLLVFKSINERSGSYNYHFMYLLHTKSFMWDDLCNLDTYRHATELEKQQLWDALAKVGKQWNAEKKCIEDLKPKRWRAGYGCRYYFAMPYKGCLGHCSDAIDYRSGQDNKRHKAGNYFKTEAEANSAGLKMKELLNEINP